MFTNCRIATTAGARNVVDAIRDGVGIDRITAPKQVTGTSWRKKDGVWVTEIGAYEDAEEKKPLKQSTPRQDVIYESPAQ